MRRVTFAVVAILVAVVLQTVLLDRLPFPGGAAPDLVLVLVVTLALASGPMPGMLIGFGAGLALDVAPPGFDAQSFRWTGQRRGETNDVGYS